MNVHDAVKNHDMISSADVRDTKVFNLRGDHVGDIRHVMIDKPSGKIAYAVMGFGGFMGMGENEHPIPWAALHYDTDKGGYVTEIDEAQLKGAPDVTPEWQRDRDWHARTYGYYGIVPYWI